MVSWISFEIVDGGEGGRGGGKEERNWTRVDKRYIPCERGLRISRRRRKGRSGTDHKIR